MKTKVIEKVLETRLQLVKLTCCFSHNNLCGQMLQSRAILHLFA